MTPKDFSSEIDKLKGKSAANQATQQPQRQPLITSGVKDVNTTPVAVQQPTPEIQTGKELSASGSASNMLNLNKSMVNDLYNVGKSAFKNLVTYANNIQGAGRQILGEKLKNIQNYESQALGHLDAMKKYLTDAETNAMNKVNLSAATQKIQGLSDAKKMFAGNTGQDSAFIEQVGAETDAKIADTKLKYTEGLINLEGQYKALKGEILDRTDINDNQKLQLVESVNQRLSDIEGQKMQFSSNLINQQYSVPMQLSQMLLQYALAKKSGGAGTGGIADWLRKSGIEGADKIADTVDNLPPDQKIAYDNITEDKAVSLLDKMKNMGSAYAKGSVQSGQSPTSINAGGVVSAINSL